MLFLCRKLLFRLRKSSLLIAITTLITVLILQSSTYPAERIKFNYSLLGFEVKVADLELFAEEGIITNRLNFYLKRISPEQREKLQEFLQQSYDVAPILIHRFSRTSVGIKMLKRLGDIIQIPKNINGFYGLRAALVQSASSDKGVNFIDFLKYFPTDIKLNLSQVLKLVQQVSYSERNTKNFIDSLKQQENITGNKNRIKDIPNLSILGKNQIRKETIYFYDRQRERTLITDLYLPETTVNNIPVVIVSNGLGARNERFEELATYLASYGFAVAVPEHPGSNHQRQQEFIKGLHKENFDATDYIDRPLDISFILDRLAVINQNQLNNRLDLENVGLFGYSIGGTTALSLAGVEINYSQLEQDCKETLDLTNISILYQCRALEIEERDLSLQDERIAAAFLFVPFGKSLFGETELNKVTIPMLWQVVDRDFLTSLTEEQLPMFNALNNSDRYLVVSENLPHSTATLSKQRSASQQNESRIARKYQNILSLVFFKKYLTNNKGYDDYLNNHLMQEITEAPYTLHLTQKIPKIDE